jgi:RsiW-degrading membrane proteinase PrsW (M82 family)
MTTAAELDTARVDAIEMSGWGRAFRFYQPRNLAFWLYLWLVGSGIITFATMVVNNVDAYGPALAVSSVVFALYGALFWWFTQRIDRYSSQPAKLVVVAFLWGGFAATWVMAAPANDAIRALYAKAFGQEWSLNWSAGLTAPFTEETAKGIGLLLIIALAPRLVRTAFDGFVLGAFIGLGFQILEDIAYALTAAGSEFGANQIGAAVGTLVMRMLTGIAAHILYSAVFCTGLVYLIGRPAEPRQVGRGLALMATAMLFHGVWDSVSGLAGSQVWLTWVLLIGIVALALVVVTTVFRMTVPKERAFLRAVMAPEVAAGVLTQAELEAMAGDRKERKAYRKAGTSRTDRRRRSHVLEAGFDLADELGTARGQDTDRVRFARQEVTRLRS